MTENNKYLDYFMMIGLIFISGNIVFQHKAFMFGLFVMATGLFFSRKREFDVTFLYFLLVLFVIFILQGFKFNFFPFSTYIGVYIRILTAYFILKSLGITFIDKFIQVMYYIAIISLLFYLPILVAPELEDLYTKLSLYSIQGDLLITRHSVLGLYTFVPMFMDKSAGPFWEMGAFGGYLVLTLLLSYLKGNPLFGKINIILILALLSTQSSTAYVAFMLLLFFIAYKNTKDIILKFVVAFFLLGLGYVIYVNVPFLGEKIEDQITEATGYINAPSLEGEDSQRFINLLKDWRDFEGHELIGRGGHVSTRYDSMLDHPQEGSEIRTVGSTDMIVRYGLPFFFLLLFYIYNSFCAYNQFYREEGDTLCGSMLIILLVLLMSETYFQYSLFWMLMMFQYIYSKDKGK